MSHHVATLQSAFDKTASVLDFAYALAERLYWLDDNYVQPFYSWAAPRLREAAINGLYWALVTLIDVSLWLIDTTRQFFARDAQAIALVAFAHIHEPLPELPALPPAPVALALPSMASAVPMPLAPGLGLLAGSVASGMALCSAPVAMTFGIYSDPNHAVQSWLTYALPLVLAPWVAESLTVPVSPAFIPVLADVAEAAPVMKKARKSAKATGKTPRKRSPKTTATTAAAQ